MKILLSAYIDTSQTHSESKLTETWTSLAANIIETVIIITNPKNKKDTETQPVAQNVKFLYYDLPLGLTKLKTNRIFMQFYKHLWQIGAARYAQKLHQKEQFDLVQDLTVPNIFWPSYMWILGIPFLWGPIKIPSLTPPPLKSIATLGIRYYFLEILHGFYLSLIKWSPFFWITVFFSSKIIVTSSHTRSFFSFFSQKKIFLISTLTCKQNQSAIRTEQKTKTILFYGRLSPSNGTRLLPKIAKSVLKQSSQYQFLIIGAGDEEKHIQDFINKNQLESQIKILKTMEKENLEKVMQKAQCLLHIGLKDQDPLPILEAINNNCPVVCLAHGIPDEIILNEGYSKAVGPQTAEKTITEITNTILNLEFADKLDVQHELSSLLFAEKKLKIISRLYELI